MSAPSAAKTLRESFGDRKLPPISRKITACVACRKLKIKCHMTNNKPPCTRCKARGLSCALNKSLQALLENDASWKEQMEDRLNRIEERLRLDSNTNDGIAPATRTTSIVDTAIIEDTPRQPSSAQPETIRLNLSGSLGAFPASSLTGSSDQTYGALHRPDLISRDVISHETAKSYFTLYKEQMDPHINYVLDDTTTLSDIRARSSFLTTAICTVVAFCTGSEDYKKCLASYMDEVSKKLFAREYEFDDVRALCVGAFWLNDISSTLNGLAVRINTQLELHRCITKMPHTKSDCFERTRLYFLVYLCDHHCSLVYGRPPMTTEFRSLKGPGAFLQSEFSNKTDLNLIAQVELWSLHRRVFNLFGSDIESTIVNQRIVELGRLSDAFDRWYNDWLDVLALTAETNSRSRRVFDFYYHSARLYLFSHVFRGPSAKESPSGMEGTGEMANRAADSALSILRCAVEGEEQHCSWLEKLPCYFGTMIAFASVCLIRTNLQAASNGDSRANETLYYLRQVSVVLKQSPHSESSTHPLLSIARSLDAAISERHATEVPQSNEFDFGNVQDLSFDFDLFASDPMNLAFPGGEDNWMLCPEQMPPLVL